MPNRNGAIMIYDTEEEKVRQVTGDYYNDSRPIFDLEGKYLFFISGRTFSPVYGDMDYTWIYPNSTGVFAATLRKDLGSPIAPRSDEEPLEKDEDKKDEDKKDKDPNDPNNQGEDEKKEKDSKQDKNSDKNDKDKTNDKDKKEAESVEIDFDGFERRVVKLPIKAGKIGSLSSVKGKLVFIRYPAAGASKGSDPSAALLYYDLDEREDKTVISGISSYTLSADGKKVLYRSGSTYGIIDLAAGKKAGDGKISTSKLKAWLDPRAEWRQIFNEAWRVQRDFFYDPDMHGLDWGAIKRRYEFLLPYVVDRDDLNYVIGEMIAELNASHTYVRGGDIESADTISVGLLGCDFELDTQNDAYKIAKIYESAVWDAEVRSPLRSPGIDVNEGD